MHEEVVKKKGEPQKAEIRKSSSLNFPLQCLPTVIRNETKLSFNPPFFQF